MAIQGTAAAALNYAFSYAPILCFDRDRLMPAIHRVREVKRFNPEKHSGLSGGERFNAPLK